MPHREEGILEQLVGRGIGASGVAGRAIQQEALPTLRQALGTAQATRAQQATGRRAEFRGRVLGDTGRTRQQLAAQRGTIGRGGQFPLTIEARAGLQDRPTFTLRGLTGQQTITGIEGLREQLQKLNPELLKNIGVAGAGAQFSNILQQLKQIGVPGAKFTQLSPTQFAQSVAQTRGLRESAFPPRQGITSRIPIRLGGLRLSPQQRSIREAQALRARQFLQQQTTPRQQQKAQQETLSLLRQLRGL